MQRWLKATFVGGFLGSVLYLLIAGLSIPQDLRSDFALVLKAREEVFYKKCRVIDYKKIADRAQCSEAEFINLVSSFKTEEGKESAKKMVLDAFSQKVPSSFTQTQEYLKALNHLKTRLSDI